MDDEELEARIVKTKAEARKNIVRREKLNIRFSEKEIERIYAAAERRGMRVMPMLRSWVIDALVSDENSSSHRMSSILNSFSSSQQLNPDLSKSLLDFASMFSELESRVLSIEQQVLMQPSVLGEVIQTESD